MKDNANREQYDRARTAFESLEIEERAMFLVEATAATVARGVERAGKALADALDGLFSAGAGQPKTDTPAQPSGARTQGSDDAHVET